MRQPSKPAEPASEHLYAVVGDIWSTPSVERARILKRTPSGLKMERSFVSGSTAVGGTFISFEDCRRRRIVGSAHVAIIEWRSMLKKRRDELLEELAQVEKVLKGPDPEEDF